MMKDFTRPPIIKQERIPYQAGIRLIAKIVGMPVMEIRRVGVGVRQCIVSVGVRMPFRNRIAAVMMIMVGVIVRVYMLVKLRCVAVRMRVLFVKEQ